MSLHILHPVMGKMANQHLAPQIQDFIHDVPQPVEEITFIPLRNMQRRELVVGPMLNCRVTKRKEGGQSWLCSVCLLCHGQIHHQHTNCPRCPQVHLLLYRLYNSVPLSKNPTFSDSSRHSVPVSHYAFTPSCALVFTSIQTLLSFCQSSHNS